MAAPVVTASVLTSRIVSSPFIGPRQDLAARVHDTAVVSAMRRIPDHIGEPSRPSEGASLGKRCSG